MFLLLGAVAKESESEIPSALFVVSEPDLNIARPDETILSVAHSEERVHSLMDQLISGPTQLSDKLFARLYIYSKTDKPGRFQPYFSTAISLSTTS